MGVLRPLIKRAQAPAAEREPATSTKIITLATAMTLARPILGAFWVGKNLVKGNKRIMPRMFFTAMTDNEGLVARAWDKLFPTSGRGVTVGGERADPVADSLMLFEVAGAAMAAREVSLLGKAALLIVSLQEGVKAKWAIGANSQFNALTGEQLKIPVTDPGKEAMAEKMLAGGLAVWTNDVEHPVVRTALGIGAVAFAVSRARRGHQEFQQFRSIGEAMIADAYELAAAPTLLEPGLPIVAQA
jgi:hypothetical protein